MLLTCERKCNRISYMLNDNNKKIVFTSDIDVVIPTKIKILELLSFQCERENSSKRCLYNKDNHLKLVVHKIQN